MVENFNYFRYPKEDNLEKSMLKNLRLRQLDFLRGIAIILVLIRHSHINRFLVNMGWIGVDLFFVLSGFLVSGLLFKEYKKHEKLNIKRFLIRRGFKIYPLFYITSIPYVFLKIFDNNFSIIHLLGDLFFLQNYVSNWGYLYAAGWSLAVEEHFYFGIAIVLFITSKSFWFKQSLKKKSCFFDAIVISILITIALIFSIRLLSNLYLYSDTKNFTLTHLRIDSLLTGVLLSYLYNFKFEIIKEFYLKNYRLLLTISFLCLIWTPFINPVSSFFVKTLGFSMLYLSFFIILLSFVIDSEINQKLDSAFSSVVVSAISKIGISSYSIYIIHSLTNTLARRIQSSYELYYHPYLYFLLTSIISIYSGFLLTKYLEGYFLNIRDKYFPRIVYAINLSEKKKSK
ncbi:acyltransferase family protein [Seonamhaeicola marinus]|uniref:Acyltransferase n=1 Tax=Seonamhaeicola marinus TaxID=1912246 RepID=A0A5D0HNB4_9FLAO|nr:acyltransferase [Seonamhaeicola marinus]TYA71547.1 acyltransferase [Seonamhaeicola marinus]